MGMDSKERQLIRYYHNKIISYNFDEKDIYSFLMLMRIYAEKNSPLLEFGDFIAHRNKDRGFIQKYLDKAQGFMYREANELPPVKDDFIEIKDVFNFEEIKSSFNGALKKIQMPLFSSKMVYGILLCIMSLLQNVEILKPKTKKPVGYLFLSVDEDKAVLGANVEIENIKHRRIISTRFLVLTLPFNGTKMKYTSPDKIHPRILEILMRDGQLYIQPTDEANSLYVYLPQSYGNDNADEGS